MTDSVLIAVLNLATALATLGGIVFGIVFGAIKLNRTEKNVEKIEIATNSMKDRLVAATAEGEFAKGKGAGRDELKAEQGAAAAAVQADKEKT